MGRQRPTAQKWDSVSHSIPHHPAATSSLLHVGREPECPAREMALEQRKAGAEQGIAEAACSIAAHSQAVMGETKGALWSRQMGSVLSSRRAGVRLIPSPITGGSSPARDWGWQARRNILPGLSRLHIPSRGMIHLWYLSRHTPNPSTEGSAESRSQLLPPISRSPAQLITHQAH